ncbi:hypothetical protein [Phreatobacter sp.]|uniref:hypothetical protein n=1 Tax=Phreatobacter sp. TaxID=1966341 RepID=UPI003F6E7D53
MTAAPSARRTVLFGALAAATLFSGSARAMVPLPTVTLFKVVGPRDEIFIGLLTAELQALGGGSHAEAISRKVASEGQMTVWRYAVSRGPDGALVMAPVAQVGIFAAGIMRIEPYSTSYAVLAPN